MSGTGSEPPPPPEAEEEKPLPQPKQGKRGKPEEVVLSAVLRRTELMTLREAMKGQDDAFAALIGGLLVRIHPPANMSYRLLHVASVVHEPNNPTWGAYFCPLGPPEAPAGTEEEKRRLWLSGDDVSARHPYMMNEVSDSAPSAAEITEFLNFNKPGAAALSALVNKRKELNAKLEESS